MAMTDNLVAYYDMSDLTTSTIEDLHGSADGTKGAANEPVEFSGHVGEAQDFDATNPDYIAFASRLGDASGAFSISFWINWDTGASSDQPFRMDAGAIGDWYIHMQSTTLIILAYYTNTGAGVQEYRFTETLGQAAWHHVVITKPNASGTGTIYIDNTSKTDAPSSSTSARVAGHRFGTRTGGAVPFPGGLDEIGIWERELSAADVALLWNNGAGLAYPFVTAAIPVIHNHSDGFTSVSYTV